MRSNILPIAVLFYAANLISALPISSTCETTLKNLLSSPDAACLNPSGLAPLFVGRNGSIVAPINNWLVGFCSAAPCSNQTLATMVTNVTSGCSTELQDLGLESASAAKISTIVQEFSPTVRKVLCLKDDSTNQICVTETLTDIEKTTGPLTHKEIVKGLMNPFAIGTGIPQDVLCSNCVKAAFNIITQASGGSLPPSVSSAATTECGASFVDGQNPTGIS